MYTYESETNDFAMFVPSGKGGGAVPGEAGVVLDVVGHDASNDCGSAKLLGRPKIRTSASLRQNVHIQEKVGSAKLGIFA